MGQLWSTGAIFARFPSWCHQQLTRVTTVIAHGYASAVLITTKHPNLTSLIPLFKGSDVTTDRDR